MINMVSTLAIARHALRYGVAERESLDHSPRGKPTQEKKFMPFTNMLPNVRARARARVSSRAVSSYPQVLFIVCTAL